MSQCLVVSEAQARKNEQAAFLNGKTEDGLIAKAAEGLCGEAIKAAASRGGKAAPIYIFAGVGNNGSDGAECALLLSKNGYSPVVFTVGQKFNDFMEKRLQRLNAAGIKFFPVEEFEKYAEKDKNKDKNAVIIDAVFGIGINRAPKGIFEFAINAINGLGGYVISADIPSGLNADSGFAYKDAVFADKTVTFSAIKSGLIMGDGKNYSGEITVCDIGVGNTFYLGVLSDENSARLKERMPASHKGTFGRVKIIGGCDEMPGAPMMTLESASAALRAGCGLAVLCVPDFLKGAYQSRVKENTLFFLKGKNGHLAFDGDALDEIIKGADSIAVGMGMGKSPENINIIKYLLQNYEKTLIIDADGLNALCEDAEILKSKKCNVILTPHMSEFTRLFNAFAKATGRTEKEVVEVTAQDIKDFSAFYGCVTAAKSATTVITDGERTYFNTTGTPAMSKAGSGDVLSGITAAFACVYPPLEAAVKACYHFGKCGERAASRLKTEVSLTASDIIIEAEKYL